MSLTSENQISQVRSRLPVPLVTRLQVEIGLKLKTKNKPITKLEFRHCERLDKFD